MNKAQLAEIVASKTGWSKADSTRAVETVLEGIREGIQRDKSVTIVGFGTFNRKHRAARTGRNPNTGEPMEIKARTTVGFKPADAFRDWIEHGQSPASTEDSSSRGVES